MIVTNSMTNFSIGSLLSFILFSLKNHSFKIDFENVGFTIFLVLKANFVDAPANSYQLNCIVYYFLELIYDQFLGLE